MQVLPEQSGPTCSPWHSHMPVEVMHRPFSRPPQTSGVPGQVTGRFLVLANDVLVAARPFKAAVSLRRRGAMRVAFSAAGMFGSVRIASMSCSVSELDFSIAANAFVSLNTRCCRAGPVRA